ncbi:hypothetical protein DFA_08573 [Cavenderia fasciculata]|uniref:FZ domain-containing protein n=1 Tax=Cavenderia fasciculata TaxID=261658 RepID=F4Q313_CACFS|nr:uncharacterized protein DFA_08573 [Cavenderia fasciculata]EGG17577.1 hypothetical protein DFA_08573 [Cavenderia fasciculata]|eukprot:XP_004356061.1 hypothetical protein DFA_08573 [Cavenderia fasciculata]
MFKIVLATLLLVAVAAAQKTYPQIPTTFTSAVEISNDQLPFPIQGNFYFSLGQQAQRVDVSQWGASQTKLDRYDLMFSFTYDGSNCQVDPITDPQSSYSVLPGSSYEGTTDINNDEVTVWYFNMMDQAFITLYVDAATNQNLVRANMTSSNPQASMTTIMDFSDFTAGVPSGAFQIPSYCVIPTPKPITPIPANVCPNNPPQGCSCAPALTFCNQVNYPVAGSAVDFATVDGMISDMYNQFTQFTSPSANCASATKAFLCATMFPQCSSGIMPLLPCAGLCISCACGGPTSACAVTNGTACTQYGSNSFC